MNVSEIIKAMDGRRIGGVADERLRYNVSNKIQQLSDMQGRPITSTDLQRVTQAVIRTAAHTDLFEDEVAIALQAGVAGEFGDDRRIIPSNVQTWITLYSGCPDRTAAVQRINVGKAIERRRADDVTADAKRESFERNGLRQAWDAFKSEGAWPFLSAGFGAAIYDKLGMDRITALLGRTDVEKAQQAALSSVRKDYPQKYRTAPDSEVKATDVFKMHAKSWLARIYFELLAAGGHDIDYNPARQ